MNVMLWLMIGAAATLAANFRVGEVNRQRLIFDLVFSALGAGIAGAAAVPGGQWLSTDVDAAGLLAAAVGATVMLVIAHLHDFRDRR